MSDNFWDTDVNNDDNRDDDSDDDYDIPFSTDADDSTEQEDRGVSFNNIDTSEADQNLRDALNIMQSVRDKHENALGRYHDGTEKLYDSYFDLKNAVNEDDEERIESLHDAVHSFAKANKYIDRPSNHRGMEGQLEGIEEDLREGISLMQATAEESDVRPFLVGRLEKALEYLNMDYEKLDEKTLRI